MNGLEQAKVLMERYLMEVTYNFSIKLEDVINGIYYFEVTEYMPVSGCDMYTLYVFPEIGEIRNMGDDLVYANGKVVEE